MTRANLAIGFVIAMSAVVVLIALSRLAIQGRIGFRAFVLASTPFSIIFGGAINLVATVGSLALPSAICLSIIESAMIELGFIESVRRKGVLGEYGSRFDGSPFGPHNKQR